MPDDGLTDTQLIGRYVHMQDALAFRELVLRHGPTVQRVCRRVLSDGHEAEDAFQITFLLLMLKAPVIRDPQLLRGWLRGVAKRVAVRAAQQAARRGKLDRVQAAMSRDDLVCAPDVPVSELREIIYDEVRRLPEEYRRPIEMCYFDGLTHQEVSRRLGWPLGTVKVRLVRGRRMLRRRFQNRKAAPGVRRLVEFQLAAPGRSADASRETRNEMDRDE